MTTPINFRDTHLQYRPENYTKDDIGNFIKQHKLIELKNHNYPMDYDSSQYYKNDSGDVYSISKLYYRIVKVDYPERSSKIKLR